MKARNSIPQILSILALFWGLVIFVGIVPVLSQSAKNPTIWLPLVFGQPALTNPIHTGIATYYNATGDGACMFGPSPNDLLVAAMNAEEYDHSAYCGAYVRVVGAKGTAVVRIVDLCPECKAGHLDLSQEAFALIDDLYKGRVTITWQVVSPELNGPIAYHFKDGSNQWWTAVQIRNHRNPIAMLEYFSGLPCRAPIITISCKPTRAWALGHTPSA